MRKIRLSERKLKICHKLVMLFSLFTLPFAVFCVAGHFTQGNFLMSFARTDFLILLRTIGISLSATGCADSLRMSYGYAKRFKSLSDSLTLSCCIGYIVLGLLCIVLGGLYVTLPDFASQHQTTLTAVRVGAAIQLMILVYVFLCFAADAIQYLRDNIEPIRNGKNSIRFSEYVWRVHQCEGAED